MTFTEAAKEYFMARRRKQTYDPRQLTLFDFMADKIEQIREENIQTDLQEQGASIITERMELRGASVYSLFI